MTFLPEDKERSLNFPEGETEKEPSVRKAPFLKTGSPKGIRTPVPGLRTRCPGPLDDGTAKNLNLAGERGFEPRSADPESAVLPLDDSPMRGCRKFPIERA